MNPLISTCVLLTLLPAVRAADFQFQDGDRVVFLGSTLIEREQRYGSWETLLTSRNPTKPIIFRNLGWSGDTVWAEARAGFGTPADAYKLLVDHVRAERPTVLIVGYGTNESFAGEAGLGKFQDGLKKLLDDLAPVKARLVLLSPTAMEDFGQPLPDPAPANRRLQLYANAMREEAARRAATFVDLFDHPADGERWTDNGMHLSALGYRRTAARLAAALGSPAGGAGEVAVDVSTRRAAVAGAGVVYDSASPWQFRARRLMLPEADPAPELRLHVGGLPPGRFALNSAGRPLAVGATEDWARTGIALPPAPDLAQMEKLRLTIVAKNELYFHRWRPQNITYLFLFRKHEQGQNAREIPQFDPLVEAKEQDIAKLRMPAEHLYELSPAKD